MVTTDKILANIKTREEPTKQTLILILDQLLNNNSVGSKELKWYLINNPNLNKSNINYTIKLLRNGFMIEEEKVKLLHRIPDLLEMRRCFYTISPQYIQDKKLYDGIKNMLGEYV